MDGSAEASSSTEPQTPKQHYRLLKRRFKFLVYENECYQEELRNLQRKLLKLSRDKNFLLDRLLPHEKLSDSSDDSDICTSKVEEPKKPKRKPRPSASRKKPPNPANADVTASSSPAPSNVSSTQTGGDGGSNLCARSISANGSVASNGGNDAGSDLPNGQANLAGPDAKERAT